MNKKILGLSGALIVIGALAFGANYNATFDVRLNEPTLIDGASLNIYDDRNDADEDYGDDYPIYNYESDFEKEDNYIPNGPIDREKLRDKLEQAEANPEWIDEIMRRADESDNVNSIYEELSLNGYGYILKEYNEVDPFTPLETDAIPVFPTFSPVPSPTSISLPNTALNPALMRSAFPVVSYAGGTKSMVFSSESEVLTFTISSSDKTNDIDLYRVSFTVSHSGLDTTTVGGVYTPGDWKIYDKSNPYTALEKATLTSNGLSGNLVFDLSTPQTISHSGTSFIITGPIRQSPTTPNNFLSIKMVPDAPEGIINGDVKDISLQAENMNNFIWSDRSAKGHSTTTKDWTNGYHVVIPTHELRHVN